MHWVRVVLGVHLGHQLCDGRYIDTKVLLFFEQFRAHDLIAIHR
jgi:hypothetical protein